MAQIILSPAQACDGPPDVTQTPSGLGVVDARSVHERVYDEIRLGLAKGLFGEGQTLTTRGLAATFGTSEMPVREAIRRLVAEKYIVQLSNRSFQVPKLDRAAFQDIIATRLVLERAATAQAAGRAGPEDAAQLRAINARLGEAIADRRIRDILRLNEEFHFALYALSGSEMMMEIVQMLWSRSGPYLTSVIARDDRFEVFSRAVELHEAILRQMEAGDPAAAAEALAEDISFAVDWYARHQDPA